MKKFVNDPANFVPEMLEGLALANPTTLKYVPKFNIIYRADAPNPGRVSVIQGSGSGHEPAHVMVVGKVTIDEVLTRLKPAEETLSRSINPTVYSLREFKSKLQARNHFLS